MKAMHGLVVVLAVMALAAGEGVEAQGWSEPIVLTDVLGQALDTDFQAAVDSRGNLHLVYYVQLYQGRERTNRVLYSKYNQNGIPLRETILPFGEDITASQGKIIIDDEDNSHIICTGRDENDERAVRYCCLNTEDEYMIDPIVIDGLYYTILYNPFYFFQRSDDTFVFSTLATQYIPDERNYHFISYARFNSEGEMIGRPHLVWSDKEADGTFYTLYSSLDEDDNMHFIWREAFYYGSYIWHYGCISADDEIITDISDIEPIDNHLRGACKGIIALSLDNIFLSMVDSRNDEEEPWVNYLRGMNSELETRFNRPFLYHQRGDGLVRLTYWNDRIYNYGYIYPDTSREISYDYYVSVDTSGEIADSLEYIRRREPRTSNPQFIRSVNTLYLFHFRGVHMPEDAAIEMVYKNVNQHVASDINIRSLPCKLSIKSVYPDPFNNSLNLHIYLPYTGNSHIYLYNLTGNLIAEQSFAAPHPGSYNLSLFGNNRLGGIPSGIYLIRVGSPYYGYQLKKVIKLK